MRYGYVRSATQDKKQIDKQIELLKRFNIDEFVIEETGYDLENLLEKLQAGDRLYVTTIDRLSRSANTCLDIATDLLAKNITVYVGDYPICFRN
jgi:DNA invertase Pin-like site-specific DNA recombinase